MQAELKRILIELTKNDSNFCAVQVSSSLARQGLSLIINITDSKLTVRVYYLRSELPGYLSFSKLEAIRQLKWELDGDYPGFEFACAWKIYPNGNLPQVSKQICEILEILGAPKKRVWRLVPEFGIYKDGWHSLNREETSTS